MAYSNKGFGLLVVAILFISLVVFLPANVQGSSRKITVPDDYKTIEEGITNANAGDTVFVKKGIYY
jgi:hypothetical protein